MTAWHAYLRPGPLLGLALATTIALETPPAKAQDPYHCIEELSEDELQYRIRRIQANFEEGQEKAAAWRFGWMFGVAGSLTLPAYNLATRESPAAQRFFEWSIIAGGVATVLQLAAVPMPAVWGAKRIRRKPQATLEDKRAKLRYATRTLQKAARVQSYFGGVNYGGAGVVYGVVMGSVYLGVYLDDIKTLPSKHDRTLARLRAVGLYLLPSSLSIGQAVSHPKHSYYYWEEYRQIACSQDYFIAPLRRPEIDFDFGAMSFRLRVRF